ncbi:PKD domain-containing protein, partial [Planctomycetota bacterium]
MCRPLSLTNRFVFVCVVCFFFNAAALAQNRSPVAEAGGPYTATVGQTITFDGSASYDPDKGDHITLYEWDLDGDGKYEVKGQEVKKTFYSATSGKVRLRVSDSYKASDTDSASYTVQNKNQPPVAEAGGPYQGTAGDPLTFDGSASYDPDKGDRIILYEWDFDGDGKYELRGETVQKIFASETKGTVRLRVRDTQQASDTDTASYEIKKKNQPPIANAGGPYQGITGEPILFDGSASYDPDEGDVIILYEWDLDNDGSYETRGAKVSKTFPSPGSGEVRLRVRDLQQASDRDTATYEVVEAKEPPPAPTGGLQGVVFHDRNRSGMQEQGEEGLDGWILYIDHNRNGKLDQAESKAISNEEGLFLFSELNPGKYRVGIVMDREDWQLVAPQRAYHEVEVVQNQIMSNIRFAIFKTLRYDYGDAPDPTFPTQLASSGARHRITLDSLCLGARVDAESDGQSHIYADGDDFDAQGDDEDGIVFRSIIRPGSEIRIDLTITNRQTEDQYAVVACWWDINGNGHWDFPDELLEYWILTALPGANTWDLGLDIPAPTQVGPTFVRFRLFQRESPEDSVVLSPEGDGGFGEVEDYWVTVR